MAITIKYNGYTFAGSGDDLLLLAPTSPPDMYEVWNPISEVLEWDTLSFGVKSDATGTKYIWTSLGQIYSTSSNEEYVIDDGDLMDYERGTPVEVYKDNVLIRKYYLDSITARHGGIFEFSCVSLVGLLDERFHKGGVYFGTTAGTIIADILTGVTYSIDNDVSGITLYGWLPYDTARANLARVLFATGASFMKTANGTPYFRFNQPQASTDVSANTFYDRESAPVERFGTVRVIEHTFFDSASQTSEVLFDNRNSVAADNALIVFDEPQASITPSTGLTVVNSGANWAIVNGTGYLEGLAYVHIKRVVEQATGVNSSEEKEITDNGLISRLNSGSVISRMANYYGNAIQHQIATKQTTEKAGDIVAFPAINGRTETGYIHTIDNVVSGFIKSHLNVIGNWTPTGLGNQYSEYFILTADDLSGGSFTIPAAHRGKPALAVLFGGAQGGAGGMDGERGHAGQPISSSVVSGGYGGAGGNGGLGAPAGTGGRYVMGEINSLAASYAGSIGAGGAGGLHCAYGEEFNLGELGGDTTFGSLSTENGVVLEGPYINLIDGTVYGEAGEAGTDGKAGGKGGDQPTTRVAGGAGANGQNYNTVWLGGKGGAGFRDGDYRGSGGGGGGAAYGSSATDATQQTNDRNPATAGANATAPAQAAFYLGGDGGHGGGGGGGSEYRYNGMAANYNNPANGGTGSAGGQGADGFVLVYV